MSRAERIRSRLQETLAPAELDVRDDSHLHAGHPGARSGKGHFHVRIKSERFTGRRPLERHRMVYSALGDMMVNDIHALSLETLAPDEPA